MEKILGHRERILRSIEHKDIDRTPFFYRADPIVNNRVKARYGLKDNMEIIQFYGADAIHVALSLKKGSSTEPDENGEYFDRYGNKVKRIQYGENYTERVVKPVLADILEIEEIYKIKWLDKSMIDMETSILQAEQAHATGLAVYGGAWASIFTHAKMMLGEEEFLCALIDDPALVMKIIERITDSFLDLNEAYFSKCSKLLDIFYFGSDFGTQNSLFISRDMFRRFFKPNLKRLVHHAKGFGLKVMFHTCGAVSGLIPDLIDCGVDILDPVQVNAINMEPSILAEHYKGKIAFHGGISTQTTLPFGTPGEVRESIMNTVKALGPLEYIAAPDQEMIGDIRVENIDMMYKTLRELKFG